MKKRILSLLLVLAMVVSMISAIPAAATGIDGEPLPEDQYVETPPESSDDPWYLTYRIVDGEAIITGCDEGISGGITIPDTLGGCPVTSIAPYAFSNCLGLGEVIIGDTVKTIDNRAFFGCENLCSITIGDGVTEIGTRAFYGCENLNVIYLGVGLVSIYQRAFRYCNNLMDVYYSGTQEQWANVYIEDGNEHLISANIYCTGVEAPPEPIEPDADFWNYEIVDDEAIITGYNYDFYGGIIVPDTLDGYPVTTIGNRAFSYYDGLTAIILPDTLVTIEENAFEGCFNLTEIDIPDGVTSIGSFAFNDCINLSTITIPASVTTIGECIFYQCHSLTGVQVDENNPNYCNDEIGALFNKSKTELIWMPSTISGAYTIPEGVTHIADYAFYHCDELTEITIPNTVSYIGVYAFNGCSNLTEVTVPGSVTTIGESAFAYCNGLTQVNLNEGLRTIGACAFEGCENLIEITIPAGVTEMGDSTFNSCTNLTGIWVDENNSKYSSDASGVLFNKSKTRLIQAPGALAGTYTVPGTVTYITYYAFQNCHNLTAVNIPASTTGIEGGSFRYSDNLAGIWVDENNPEYSSDAYGVLFNKDKSELVIAPAGFTGSYTIPNSVVRIRDCAFQFCTGLTEVVIPDSVTDIGCNAFQSCQSLTEITIPDGVECIYNWTFGECYNLTKVTLGAGIAEIYSSAFHECYNLTDVFYNGTEDRWNQLYIEEDNYYLTAANIYFTGGDPECFTYDIVNGEAIITGCDNSVSGRLTIPETLGGCTVTAIGDSAFAGCSGLTQINVFASITTIGENAFEGCDSLTDVYYTGTEIQWAEIAIGEGNEALISADIHFESTWCDHKYDNDCDTECNLCFETRTTDGHKITPYVSTNATNYPFTLVGDIYTSTNTYDDTCATFILTVIADCELTITYRTSTEENYDELIIEVNSETLVAASGHKSWRTVSLDLRAGDEVFISYSKDGSESSGDDSVSFKLQTDTMLDADSMEQSCSTLSCGICGVVILEGFGHSYTNDYDTTCDTCGASRFLESVPCIYGDFEYNIVPDGNGGHAEITGYLGSETVLTIPDTIDGWKVTAIGDDAFYERNSLDEIILPDGITTIGNYAFFNCNNLAKINLPDSVTAIGDYAFEYCFSLDEIILPASLKTIGDEAFYNCSNLAEIVLPEGLITIGIRAFACCYDLSEITIPASVTEIGSKAFDYCTNLTGITVAEDNLNYSSDASGVLYNKEKTKLIVAPYTIAGSYEIAKSVTYIEDYAFYNCSALTEVIIPDGVSYIGNFAFAECANLTEITIPSSVSTIEGHVFAGCVALAKVNLQEGLKSIEENAFWYCRALTEITIPDTVSYIGSSAFAHCSSLTGIWVDENNLYYCNDAFGVLYDKEMTTLMAAPGELTGSYTIPDGVTAIDSYAFGYCSELTGVHIPYGVEHIGSGAFRFCSALTQINLPESVTQIDGEAFSYCSNLTEIQLPTGLRAIEYSTFLDAGLTNITLPDGVEYIGSSAFYGCSNLTEITIPASVYEIQGQAFGYCNFLTDVLYGGTEEQWDEIYIGYENECLTLANIYFMGAEPEGFDYEIVDGEAIITGCDTSVNGGVTIPKFLAGCRVTAIGNGAFDGCQDLVEITIPNSITAIGDDAFLGCDALQTVNYGGMEYQWEEISIGAGNDALLAANVYFADPWYLEYEIVEGEAIVTGCDYSVSSIVIPSTLGGCPVTAIADYAFQAYDNLTKVVIADSVTTIGEAAFNGCASLAEIDLPNGLTAIGSDAFCVCSGLTEITIPTSVTYIGAYAFYNCISLTKVNLQDGLETIGDFAFSLCSSLTEITIPGSVTTIGDMAFASCTALTKVNLQDGLEAIGDCAFSRCSNLTEITIPGGVTEIGYHAFSYCTSLTEITIPSSVITIGVEAFYNCSSLTEITIPGSVTRIGSSAFENCTSLTEITIPTSVTYIYKRAFYECVNLTDVYYGGTEEQWQQIGIDYDNEYLLDANIHFTDPYWYLEYEIVEGETIVTGCDNSVSGSITIPDTLGGYPVTTIDNEAFYNCSSLTEITIPGSVTEIGYDAFSYCSRLTEITIPGSVTTIGNYAFYNCSALTKVNLQDGLETIGDSAFTYCSSLTEITIPGSVTTIGSFAFYNCPSLTRITVAEANSNYSSDANGVLFDKKKARLIQAPGALSGSYTIPESVTDICDCAFYECYGLTEITIPVSVTSIGACSFYECVNLTDVYYGGTEEQWQKISIEIENACLLNANIHYASPNPDPTDPTEPTEPTVPPTEPTEPPTEPTEPPTEPTEPPMASKIVETNALCQTTFNVYLIEPWALRINATFYDAARKPIPVTNFASYGAYAIIESKFENFESTDILDLVNDPDAVKFEMGNEGEPGKAYSANGTAVSFEFTDGLYTYNLSENVYYVAYYEDANGDLHFTRIRTKTMTSVIDSFDMTKLETEEAAVYESMKAMEETVVAYREVVGTSAKIYADGISAANVTLGKNVNTGTYKFNATYAIKLIEPWGFKVNVLMVGSGNKQIDYASAEDYGLILFYDKTGKYGASMSIDQMLAEGEAVVYSKSQGNAIIENNRVVAMYDEGIYTYEMDSVLFCLPYVVVGGQYNYRTNGAFAWNLIDKIGEFAANENLGAEERAVYSAILETNADVLAYRDKKLGEA